MAGRVAGKIKLASVDELLGVPDIAGTQEIELGRIKSFKNHPFKVLDDEKMDALVDSIRENGVLNPVIVRPDEYGNYEMVSGHRRLHAAQIVGLGKIPAIVKEMTDDEATIVMVDANIQREELLPSEKAFAYKMKLDAMKRTAGRPCKNNVRQSGTHLRSDEELAEQTGDSARSIQRYIRLVYVYEGIDTEESGRPKLIRAKYFGGVYEGTDGVRDFWREVADYIESAYDTEKIKHIYINGDGAAWIKTGVGELPKAKFVLDKFHMHKYITTATAHLLDSAEDARSEIYRAIHKTGKKACEEAFDKILAVTDSESKKKAVETSKGYILSNWAGIQLSMKGKNKNIECSAEGHVSHIFSDRMSSRPLGWSRTGCAKMAKLRVYQKNGGNMLELVRYQKAELPKAAGAEEVIYSATQMLVMENRNRERVGMMADMPEYSIPYPQIKKIAALKNHIWGL